MDNIVELFSSKMVSSSCLLWKTYLFSNAYKVIYTVVVVWKKNKTPNKLFFHAFFSPFPFSFLLFFSVSFLFVCAVFLQTTFLEFLEFRFIKNFCQNYHRPNCVNN